MIVYQNAVTKRHVAMDYHAIPHAVFTYPEIAAVGLREKRAVEKHGEDNVLIGFCRYENTAKGEAMNVKDYFVRSFRRTSNSSCPHASDHWSDRERMPKMIT